MSTRNTQPTPPRTDGESTASYLARLESLYDAHLGSCYDCDYNKECQACYADGDHPPEVHSCNCSEHGWGTRVSRAIREARKESESTEGEPHCDGWHTSPTCSDQHCWRRGINPSEPRYGLDLSVGEIVDLIDLLDECFATHDQKYRDALKVSDLKALRDRLAEIPGTE